MHILFQLEFIQFFLVQHQNPLVVHFVVVQPPAELGLRPMHGLLTFSFHAFDLSRTDLMLLLPVERKIRTLTQGMLHDKSRRSINAFP